MIEVISTFGSDAIMHGVIDIGSRTSEYVRANQLHARFNNHGVSQSPSDVTDLEWSDYGRDPRFLAGWWIMPLSLLSVLSVWLSVVA